MTIAETQRWLAVASLAVSACSGAHGRDIDTAAATHVTQTAATPPAKPVAVVRETYLTRFDSADNIDGPAVYRGRDGIYRLLATAKGPDVIIVYDAATGAVVKRVGATGTAPGQLRRPNGIIVLDDSIALVVERDNARVQGFRLPDFEPIGTFGEKQLRLPYGITSYAQSPGVYMVYVTDNYQTADDQVPPDRDLGARVKQFRVRIVGGKLRAEHVRNFGDTKGDGVIRVAESIVADPAQGLLAIAEEMPGDSYIKVYDLDGRFTGRVFGREQITQQAEGIALYTCGDAAGYWIATDQGDTANTFHVFDRASFNHLGSFTGAAIRRTDGVTLTQRAFGPFPAGVFFGSHLDGGVGALSWIEIARALRLRADCRP
jgi:3-phytase